MNSAIPDLSKDLEWLRNCIRLRVSITQGENHNDTFVQPPSSEESDSMYADFVVKNKLRPEERLLLILALSLHLDPNIINLFTEDENVYRCARLYRPPSGMSVLPTGETFLYIAAGDDLEKRVRCYSLFDTAHLFYKQSVIELGEVTKGESIYNGIISITQTFRDLFIYNAHGKPRFSPDFPAHLLTTRLEWNDMVLMPRTRESIEEVQAYLEHYSTMVNELGMAKHARAGCRILFYGDPGTGKTLAASLLGKHLGKDVYRVDISAVTSKYIGESTKRLDSLFNTAESKGWIIFIDEGDALLGQRKSTENENNSSHYANQDVAFLLQRIENYDGIIIVATNLKNNLDRAFLRRFQGMVRFHAPDEAGQLRLWQENISSGCPLDSSIDLQKIIRQHPLTPASIVNVIFRTTVLALKRKTNIINADDLLTCIKDEELRYMGRQQQSL